MVDPRHRMTPKQAITEFYDVLLPDPDPASMKIAQDLVEEYGLKLADLGEAMAKNSWENRHYTETHGWADYDPSSGQFTVSQTQAPYRVIMRPPERGERGWWVHARTPEAALVEILREGGNDQGNVGWLAPNDITDEPDEHDMIAVTIERDPSYMAAWWSVWHRPTKLGSRGATWAPGVKGGGYRIGLGVWYGGKQWDEGGKGIAGVQLSIDDPEYAQLYEGPADEYYIDRQKRSLPGEVKRLPPILPEKTYRTLADARREATMLAWQIATELKIARRAGIEPASAAAALRGMSPKQRPPRAIVNPRINSMPPGGRGGRPGIEDYVVVRINRDNADTYAAPVREDRDALEDAIAAAVPDEGAIIEWGVVYARDAGEARLLRPQMWIPYEPPSENPPRIYRPQRVVAQLQKETRPAFKQGSLIGSPEDVAIAMADYIGARATEAFVVLFVNVRNQLVGYTEMSSGSTASVSVDGAGIFREALAAGAAAIITIHNHPSGDPDPSDDDRQLWKRLAAIGELMGVPVLDDMVIGETQYYSRLMQGRGDLPAAAKEGAR